jgi:hypothetical protein
MARFSSPARLESPKGLGSRRTIFNVLSDKAHHRFEELNNYSGGLARRITMQIK